MERIDWGELRLIRFQFTGWHWDVVCHIVVVVELDFVVVVVVAFVVGCYNLEEVEIQCWLWVMESDIPS